MSHCKHGVRDHCSKCEERLDEMSRDELEERVHTLVEEVRLLTDVAVEAQIVINNYDAEGKMVALRAAIDALDFEP